MVMEYDPQVIVQFAQRLYTKAARIVATYTLVGILIGVLGGMLFGGVVSIFGDADAGMAASIGVVCLTPIAGLLAYVAGVERAFALKLQAQTALCQIQIEFNTRRARFRGPER